MARTTTNPTSPTPPTSGEPTYWLIKSEGDVYSFAQLQTEKQTSWTGVRNFEARNNLRAMKLGDLLLYYHSNTGKEVVGIARVVKQAYPDPTADEGDWWTVDVEALCPLPKAVTLAQIKTTPKLAKMHLLTKPRVSVVSVTKGEFSHILKMAGLASGIPLANQGQPVCDG